MKQIITLLAAMMLCIAFSATAFAAANADSIKRDGPKRSVTYHVFNNDTAHLASKTSDSYNCKGWSKVTLHAHFSNSTTANHNIQAKGAEASTANFKSTFRSTTGASVIRYSRTVAVDKENSWLQFILTQTRSICDFWITFSE